MKKLIILSLIICSLAACKKDEKVLPKNPPPAASLNPVATAPDDTIAEKAAFIVQLVKDKDNYDATMFRFSNKASVDYVNNEDAAYFAGFGEESLASLSKDGRDLAINMLPYTPGMSVGLDVGSKKDGDYSFGISYESKIPPTLQIWIKDNYLKDSVNMCAGTYKFKVVKADPNSFGSKRFEVVLKRNTEVQTKHPN